MSPDPLLDPRTHDPDRLLDALLAKLRLKNDAALSRALGLRPPAISKIRHRKIPVGPVLLIRMHEASGLSIAELRQLMRPRKIRQRGYLSPAARLEKLALLREKAAAHGGQCLADAYVNGNTPLRFQCCVHGPFDARPRHILAGQWCRRCGHDRTKADAPQRLLRYIAERGGLLKSPYVNARTHVVVTCPIHGDWRALPDNLLSKGTWCLRCGRSQPRPGRRKKTEANAGAHAAA